MIKRMIILLLLIFISLPSSSFAVDTKIKVQEGESIFLESLEESKELNLVAMKIPRKLFIEYADTLSENEFILDIDPKIVRIPPYIFIEYSDTIYILNLLVDDDIKKISRITPRIMVEYADTILSTPLTPTVF